MHFLYGSQMGNSESIARMLHDTAIKEGAYSSSVCMSLDDSLETSFWNTPQAKQPALAVIVCSSTGQGDFPDNATRFQSFLRTAKDGSLGHIAFAVLAVGDSSYETFCFAGKAIDRGLEKLGARRFHPRGDADDGTGLDAVVVPWTAGLWDAMRAVSHPTTAATGAVATTPGADELHLLQQDLEQRFDSAPQYANALLSAWQFSDSSMQHDTLFAAADEPVVELTFEVTGASWEPGDTVSVDPMNSDEVVDALLQWFGVPFNEPFFPPYSPDSGTVNSSAPVYAKLSYPLTYRDVLSRSVSLRLHNKAILAMMVPHVNADDAKYLKSILNDSKPLEDSLGTNGRRCTVLDLVSRLARPFGMSLRRLIECLVPMQRRYYSIASCCDTSSGVGKLVLAVKVVHGGVCSNWLLKQCRNSLTRPTRVALNIRKTKAFRPPASPTVPLILIGPGVGIAPFIGFLQQRLRAGGPTGEAVLYTGSKYERSMSFHAELETIKKEADRASALIQLRVALSREGPQIHVQALLQEDAAKIYALINIGASIYVCGGNSMAKEVHTVLRDIVQTQGKMSREEADQHMAALLASKRYLRDTWAT